MRDSGGVWATRTAWEHEKATRRLGRNHDRSGFAGIWTAAEEDTFISAETAAGGPREAQSQLTWPGKRCVRRGEDKGGAGNRYRNGELPTDKWGYSLRSTQSELWRCVNFGAQVSAKKLSLLDIESAC